MKLTEFKSRITCKAHNKTGNLEKDEILGKSSLNLTTKTTIF